MNSTETAEANAVDAFINPWSETPVSTVSDPTSNMNTKQISSETLVDGDGIDEINLSPAFPKKRSPSVPELIQVFEGKAQHLQQQNTLPDSEEMTLLESNADIWRPDSPPSLTLNNDNTETHHSSAAPPLSALHHHSHLSYGHTSTSDLSANAFHNEKDVAFQGGNSASETMSHHPLDVTSPLSSQVPLTPPNTTSGPSSSSASPEKPIVKHLSQTDLPQSTGYDFLNSLTSPEEVAKREALIRQVVQYQKILQDEIIRVYELKSENKRLNQETMMLRKYAANLMATTKRNALMNASPSSPR